MLVKVTYQIILNVNILCYIPVGWSPFRHSDLLPLMRIYECSHGFILCYINWNQMCLKIHMYVCIYPYILKEKKKTNKHLTFQHKNNNKIRGSDITFKLKCICLAVVATYFHFFLTFGPSKWKKFSKNIK